MNNSILDVAIGLIFLYLLYSLLATTVKELISTIFSYRSRMLERGLEQMLDGRNYSYYWWDKAVNFFLWLFQKNTLKLKEFSAPKTLAPTGPDANLARAKLNKKSALFAANITSHPIYKRSAENSLLFKKPAYLAANVFSDILLDVLKNDETPVPGDATLLTKIDKYINVDFPGNDDLKRILNIYLSQANGDLQRFKLLLENWYDETMERVSGWYKKQATRILLMIGFCIAVAFNVSTIDIVKKISIDKDARAAMVKSASAYLDAEIKQVGDRQVEAQSSKGLDGGGKQGADTKSEEVNGPADPATGGRPGLTSDSASKKPTAKIDSAHANKTTDLVDTSHLNTAITSAIRSKLDTIKSLYNDNIAEVNTTLGLGWGDFNYKNDSLAWVKDSIANKAPRRKNVLQKIFYVLWETVCTPHYLLGFILTAFAISLGAPFWFDLLNKFMNLRISGKKPDETNKAELKTSKLNKNPDPTAKG